MAALSAANLGDRMRFTIHTIETAPPAARADLQAARKAIRVVPNLLGVGAEAPIALKACTGNASLAA